MEGRASLARRRVLVTGAGGFIGSHLVEALVREGATVRALVRYDSRSSSGWLSALPDAVRASVEIVRGDIRDAASVLRAVAGRETVFHLASLVGIPYSYDAPEAYVATNLGGALNVLDACRTHDVGLLVHTSTSEVYGTARTVPIREDHPLHPQSPYAATKSGADQLALSYHAAFALPVVVLRPFNTYGPRQSLRAVIPTIAAQLITGGPVRLGSVTPTRDFTFVADTVDAFLRVAVTPSAVGRTIHAGTGIETSVHDIAALLADLCGTTLALEPEPARMRPVPSEVERLVADPSLARELIGWRATVPLRDGLRSTLDWLRESDLVGRSQEYVR